MATHHTGEYIFYLWYTRPVGNGMTLYYVFCGHLSPRVGTEPIWCIILYMQ